MFVSVQHAELSALLGKASAFQGEVRRLGAELRRAVESGALAALKTCAGRPALRDALAASAALQKAAEALARDEKVHDTRHTAESKVFVFGCFALFCFLILI